MFDVESARKFAEKQETERIQANVGNLSSAQRTALVSLLGGSATLFHRDVGRWVVPCLGQSWAIAPVTMDSLVREGFVTIDGKARLTKRGKWYAITAACREADERYPREQL